MTRPRRADRRVATVVWALLAADLLTADLLTVLALPLACSLGGTP